VSRPNSGRRRTHCFWTFRRRRIVNELAAAGYTVGEDRHRRGAVIESFPPFWKERRKADCGSDPVRLCQWRALETRSRPLGVGPLSTLDDPRDSPVGHKPDHGYSDVDRNGCPRLEERYDDRRHVCNSREPAFSVAANRHSQS